MDPANHGGIKGKLPSEAAVQQSQPESEKRGAEEDDSEGEEGRPLDEDEVLNKSDDEDEPEIEMNWNLMHFLPEAAACQTNFNMIVAGYILSIYNHMQEEQQRMTPGSTPIRRHDNSSQTQKPDSTAIPATITFAQELVQGDLSQQMFALTQKIQKKLSGNRGGNRVAAEFPQPPGSHLMLHNPALEFVKAIAKVLALDTSINLQVTKMKRDLLKLIGVGEFAPEAQFKDPCLSYILPEVICKSCNHIRDLDLCRDPYLSYDGSGSVWACVHCRTDYDLTEIEQSLVNSVNRKSMAYVLQDLKCMKCQGVKESNMQKYCKCAGDFTGTLKMKDLARQLKTFRGIAKHYSMSHLLETVEWIIQMNPGIPVT
ncbi:hypothetical protein ScPMuIL_002466 [Solemya velum]